ncbi:ABC transporter substrate-binding protein [Pseudochelatococcus sp. B33]
MITDILCKIRWMVAVAGVAALVAPAAGNAAEIRPLDPPADVKIAYVPIMKFAAAFVAKNRGLFEKYGLNVEFERARSGTEVVAFIDQGSVDVGGIAIVASLWSAWKRGLDVRVIAPGALDPVENGPTVLIAHADRDNIKSVADLKGKRIAVAGGPGSGGEYHIAKALELANLTIRDVELMNVSNADMPASIEAGTVDAVLTSSPFSDQILGSGTGRLIGKDFTLGLMTVAFVGSGRFIRERPEVAERFVLALTEATRMMQGDDYLNPENIAAYLAHTASTEEAIRIGSPPIYDPNVAIPIDGLVDAERVHRENGRTEYDEPLDLSKVVDETFVDKAIGVLGRF